MRRDPNQSNGGVTVAIVIIFFLLMILGYGGTAGRGFAWGMGREAAHAMWRR